MLVTYMPLRMGPKWSSTLTMTTWWNFGLKVPHQILFWTLTIMIFKAYQVKIVEIYANYFWIIVKRKFCQFVIPFKQGAYKYDLIEPDVKIGNSCCFNPYPVLGAPSSPVAWPRGMPLDSILNSGTNPGKILIAFFIDLESLIKLILILRSQDI